MSLSEQLLNPGPEVYYDPAFRAVFEDHLNYILNTQRGNMGVQSVDDNTAARFAGDWRGLAMTMQIEPHMSWFQMRINGWTSTTEYDGVQKDFYILRNNVVDQLAAQFRTKKKN